ncbi:MAG TPA: hypothetical protein VEX87_14175 [Skermanella sp.]|nr:hypothetical protein [Skermanella sp.]
MEGVGGEQHAGQAQLGDHPLGGGDLVALDVDFAVRQQDRRLGGEGAQRLGRLAVVEVVEAALQGLAAERDDRHPVIGLRHQALGVPAERLFQGVAVQVLKHRAQDVDRWNRLFWRNGSPPLSPLM